METIAVVIIIGLCLIAVAGCIGLAFRNAETHGWMSTRALASITAGIVIAFLAVWAVIVTFDAEDAGADAAPVAVREAAATRGPAGYAGNGNCPPECLAAHRSYRLGAAAARYLMLSR